VPRTSPASANCAEDLAEATAQATAAALPGAVAIRTDVTDRVGVQALADQVTGQFGRIDVLVNNAGWDKASPFVDSDPADWDRAIAVNLYGVLHTCKAVLPVMAEQCRGAVVNLASDAGRVGSSGEAVYSAAKGGVIAFTKSLAREMARHDISTCALDARIGDGHVKLGVAAGDHAAILWPLLCGMATARYYLLTGEMITGEETERLGMVSRAVPREEVLDEALRAADSLATGSQPAIRWTKRALNNWLKLAGPIFDQSAAYEMLCFMGPDVLEGTAAITEKRQPRFPSAPSWRAGLH
jgi:NAD(P)-dependent dehydrogenase (short-subunit alcohol dehydrogenase family)